MNKMLPFLCLLIFTLLMIGWITAKKSRDEVQQGSKAGFAVVELFTSEGCSSCPPADEAVAKLLAKNKANVFILAYHVDYWNRLGWTDPFSKADFSKRQTDYGLSFNLQSVYTPQVVVNGSVEFVGSDEEKLTDVVDQSLPGNAALQIMMEIKRKGNHIEIIYQLKGNESNNQLLNFALVQNEATVSVKKGENGGRNLHHVNIVRELKTMDAGSNGTVSMEIGDDISTQSLQIIAFSQEKKNLHISAALQKSL